MLVFQDLVNGFIVLDQRFQDLEVFIRIGFLSKDLEVLKVTINFFGSGYLDQDIHATGYIY